MSFDTIAVPSYPQNSLRFGLIDIKPVDITEDAKLGKIKVRVTRTKLQPTKPVSTFEELVVSENNEVFSSITIPERFKVKELANNFSKLSIETFQNDNELQTEIENMKRLDRKKPFYNFIQFMTERFEKERESHLDIEAKRFLASNFPLTFYHKFIVYENTYYDFLKTLKDIVRTHEFLANYSRNSQMYAKRIATMQHELGPLIDKFDKCSFACTRLKKYVSVWNSETYDELPWPDFLNFERTNLSEFEQLSNDFNIKLKEMRMALLEFNPNIWKKTIDNKDSTTKMIGNLLVLPSSSFGGEQ